MRFDRVDATAFGALRGRSLDLPEPMTIIHGPNEAGKSTWFAALYAGLAGRKVSRGRGTKAQVEFRRKHKPWVGSQWRVSLTMTLDSGRRLRLEHDLQAGEVRIADAATDRFLPLASLERELGLDLDVDGGFDGARLLGLNREAVRSTMFVGQADILGVLRNAEELQEHLQRAASSVRLDTTAEQAIDWITQQRSERVGSAHVGNRPLRASSAVLNSARERLGDLLDARHNLQELYAARITRAQILGSRETELTVLKREIEWLHIAGIEARISRARQLTAQIEALAETPLPAADEAVARVTSVLEGFKARAETPAALDGMNAAELRVEIDALPPVPQGPRRPEPAVLEGERRLNDAEATLETLRRNAPPASDATSLDVASEELRLLAQYLNEAEPLLEAGTLERITALQSVHSEARAAHARQRETYQAEAAAYAAAQSEYEREREVYSSAMVDFDRALTDYRREHAARSQAQEAHILRERAYGQAVLEHQQAGQLAKRSRGLALAGLVSGAVIVIAAVIGVVVGAIPVGVALGVFGVGLLSAGGVAMGRRTWVPNAPVEPHESKLPDVRPEPARPSPPQPPRPMGATMPGDPPAPPADLVAAERAVDRWEDERRAYEERHSRAIARAQALDLPQDPARLREIARAIDDRDAAEQRFGDYVEHVSRAEDAVADAARRLLGVLGARCDESGNLPRAARLALDQYATDCAARDAQGRSAERRADLVRALEERLLRENEHRQVTEAFTRAEAELIAVAAECGTPRTGANEAVAALDGWRLEQRRLMRIHADKREHESRLDQLLDGGDLDDLQHERDRRAEGVGDRPQKLDPEAEGRLDRVEEARADAASEVARLDGRIRETEQAVTSIPEAMEREALAQRDVDRVRALADCLDLAERHLSIAKERAHADIAPMLEHTIRPWVPRVTGGNFVDVDIDASSLMVRAVEAGGRPREADVLSQGTMEQLFLLLRIALAEHLASTSETAPLVLDDVTVQSDRQRTEAILELLREISSERQVVFFTQELEVISWAIQNLSERALIAL